MGPTNRLKKILELNYGKRFRTLKDAYAYEDDKENRDAMLEARLTRLNEEHEHGWNQICKLADKLLANDDQEDFWQLIQNCSINDREDLKELRDLLAAGYMETFNLRQARYEIGHCNEVFEPFKKKD